MKDNNQFKGWSRSRLVFECLAQAYAHYVDRLVNFDPAVNAEQANLFVEFAQGIFSDATNKKSTELEFQFISDDVDAVQPSGVNEELLACLKGTDEYLKADIAATDSLKDSPYMSEAKDIIIEKLREGAFFEDENEVIVDALMVSDQRHYDREKAGFFAKVKGQLPPPSGNGGNPPKNGIN